MMGAIKDATGMGGGNQQSGMGGGMGGNQGGGMGRDNY